MVEKILDKASYSIVRTNPKLTGNVKVISNGSDIYLESFSANRELSSSRFKAFKVSGKSTYDKDVFRFFQLGETPKDIVYQVFQEFRDIAVLPEYSNQYEMFYSTGTRSVASDSYSEDLGMLAPIWLNEQIPNYFVIFRLDDPAAVNATIPPSLQASKNLEDLAQTTKAFREQVLNNCTAIKTFDLSENSTLGKYIRNYRNQETFPKAPLSVSWRKDEKLLWSGIDLQKGGFKTSGSFAYDDLIGKDATIIQNEYFFTEGFQRNGVLLANLINLEFLFTDTNAPDYSINRYFGLYVNEIEEGEFDISGEGFFKNTEKSQLPKIKTINEVSETLNTPFEITNENGVLVFLDPTRSSTITGFPTPERLEGETSLGQNIEGIFYVKDKNGDFHTIKRGSKWGTNQIRLFDKKIDISVLAGFQEPDTFAQAEVLSNKGKSLVSLQVLGELDTGLEITFTDTKSNSIETINASSVAAPNPGTSSFNSFCPSGTPQEIAKAITLAINKGIPEHKRFYDASYNNDTVYIQSRFAGSRFNEITMNINFLVYPSSANNLLSYPVTDAILGGTQTVNFIGGNDLNNSRLKVEAGDQDRFIKGNSIQTKNGFGIIGDFVPYLEQPIKDPIGNIIGYTDVDKYVVINTNSDQVLVTNNGQVALYKDYKSTFGRFSFFPVKDFDYDFYSELYSELGELKFEENKYNAKNTTTGNYIGVANNPEVRTFYDDGGFANLIGLLKDADPDEATDPNIKSPYKRLEENFLKSQAVASRVIPYINKWSWYNEGKDVRNHPYSLNLSEAFSINDFAPSKYAIGQDALGFTHEWYYLSEFPSYFLNSGKKQSWSYSDKAPVDTIEANPVTGAVYTPGTFQRVDVDEFSDYFIKGRFESVSAAIPDYFYVPLTRNKLIRYGRFSGGDTRNFASTFLRGVRVIAKTKASPTTKPNFNAKKLKYVSNGDFNDYRFSAILIPNAPDKPQTQIKFVKNEKWKTVVMMIFINFDNECVNNGAQSVDRTSLYSFESNYQTTGCIPDLDPGGNYIYKNGPLQGAISFLASSLDPSINQILIQGIPDVNNLPTRFLRDIKIGADGQYTPIKITVTSGGTTDVYEITGISRVINDSQFFASKITKNGNPFFLPFPSPPSSELVSATYETIGGGFNTYSQRLTNVGFATIFNNVNQGDPNIIYETIHEDGTRALTSTGELAQTFSIELRAQEDILKAVYLGVLPDPAKPTVFNLTDIIGFDLSIQRKPRITPIGRHAGFYEPTANDVLFFTDPYVEVKPEITVNDYAYKEKVYNLTKHANANFLTNAGGGLTTFGSLQNLFYHKVNEEDPSAVLELSEDGAFQSLYPLINEVGIDKRRFYMFSSNWEPGYFRKNIDKATSESIIGTRAMQEKKSFYGSKYLKVPQEIKLETFTISPEFLKDAISQPSLVSGDYMVNTTKATLEFYLFIQKRLTEFLFTPIKEQFIKYIKPEFSFGDDETLDDDVRAYIEDNILRLYKVQNIELYTKEQRARKTQPTNIRSPLTTADDFSTSQLIDSEKINNGLRVANNISSQLINTNPFDLKLIYNKRKGFTESFGFSVTIVKK